MNDFDNIVKRMSVTRLEPGDYTGEDGLLYCGKCRTPKQFRMDKPLLEGRPLFCPCRCEQSHTDHTAGSIFQAHRNTAQTISGLAGAEDAFHFVAVTAVLIFLFFNQTRQFPVFGRFAQGGSR